MKKQSSEMWDDILNELDEGKVVRRNVSFANSVGKLYVDRKLPFLCVYRRPGQRPDPGTGNLIQGESSYFSATEDEAGDAHHVDFIRALAAHSQKEFGSFLIVEVWSGADGAESAKFNIRARSQRAVSTVEMLDRELRKIRIFDRSADVNVQWDRAVTPPGMKPLLTRSQAERLGCHVIGLEVSPIYRDSKSGKLFPLVLRTLHSRLSHALRRAFFSFASDETTSSPPHAHSLGRKVLVKAVWDIDNKLADISESFDFLLLSSPSNPAAEFAEFQKRNFQRVPAFRYRPIPFDPVDVKRRLFNIRTDRVEAPTLAFLFNQKRRELERMLSMVQDRNTKNYLYGSLQLFGGIDEQQLKVADEILTKVPPAQRSGVPEYVTVAEFAARAREEMRALKKQYPALNSRVEIRDDITGLLVSKGRLFISRSAQIPPGRVEALIQHEVGTHILTYFNGKAQPFRQLYCGLSGYDELQEGLAVLAEFLVGGLTRTRLRLLAARVRAVHMLLDGATFIDIFRKVHEEYAFEPYTAFSMATRTCRGGGLTKDATYLRGLVNLLDYLKKGGELEPLYVGKISAKQVPMIEELTWRGILTPPPLTPTFLKKSDAQERLKKIRDGIEVWELADD